MPKGPFLIVVGGPTASGKTAVAIRLARHFNTEILSADSRQIYREMSIGTAKPSAEELAAVRHHFIDIRSVADPYSAGDYERDALQLLKELFTRKSAAVCVGGTGLFIRALCEGLDKFPEIGAGVKEAVSTGETSGGTAWLQNELSRLDPAYYEKVDRDNPARLRRALEVCLQSGRPYSEFLRRGASPRPFTPVYLCLDMPRPELYARIEARVDQMVAAGLEEEARSLLPWRNQPALRTVGYEEFFDYFDGKYGREECVDKIKQHTRNYAKRQVTWFKKHAEWTYFHPDDEEGMMAELSKFM